MGSSESVIYSSSTGPSDKCKTFKFRGTPKAYCYELLSERVVGPRRKTVMENVTTQWDVSILPSG